MSQFDIRRITSSDNLAAICDQTKPERWAADNEMKAYDEKTLRKFLLSGTNWLVIAWSEQRIASIALCYELLHPDGDEHTLYVHELNTHPEFRRQGVATNLMQWLRAEAKSDGMSEVWLGTEQDAATANEFYQSLKPNEILPTIIYSYVTKQK